MTSARHSIAALDKWSRTPDRAAATAPARTAFEERFARQARAEHPGATDEQVARRADAARRAYYLRLSQAGVAARRRRAS